MLESTSTAVVSVLSAFKFILSSSLALLNFGHEFQTQKLNFKIITTNRLLDAFYVTEAESEH